MFMRWTFIFHKKECLDKLWTSEDTPVLNEGDIFFLEPFCIVLKLEPFLFFH
jgi:hypothetical protein